MAGLLIAQVVGEAFCHSADGGRFLKRPAEPARLVMHSRGDNRDLLYVRASGEEGLVRIDGDSDSDCVTEEVNYPRLTKPRPGLSATLR